MLPPLYFEVNITDYIGCQGFLFIRQLHSSQLVYVGSSFSFGNSEPPYSIK